MESTIEAKPLFAAKLTPHRSLTPRGRRIVIGIVAVLAAIPGLVLSRLGAWPVIGFMGLDILGVWWALSASGKQDRAFEEVTLWRDHLDIRQVSVNGKEQKVSFNPFFVKLVLERDHDERTNAIWLKGKDSDLEIGAFLNPDDKASFAQVFGTALKKARA